MSQKNNEDFSMFNTLDVQVKDLARKSYRAIPHNLWIYLEGDSLPHELCNISITGLCFKINSDDELGSLSVGKCFQIHIFSEIHDDILTLEVQVVRTTEETCSCFFPNIATKEEKFLDKLILEMQKQVITQRKLAHKKELEREKIQVQELRRLQQLNKMRLEEIHSKTKNIAINPFLDEEHTSLANLAQHINTDFQLEDKKTNTHALPDTSVTRKMNDFTLFEDINIVTDAQNRKTYRTNPTNLWVYIKGILRPHKILNLSTSGICFKYKPTQVILTKNDKIEIEIFCNIREKILSTPAKVVRIDKESCSCILPSLAGDNMVLLSKLVAEMKKVEISADSVEELRALMIAFETQEMADRKQQLDFLAQEETRIRDNKARLLAIVEEESRIRHEKFNQKHRQVQEYIEQNKTKDTISFNNAEQASKIQEAKPTSGAQEDPPTSKTQAGPLRQTNSQAQEKPQEEREKNTLHASQNEESTQAQQSLQVEQNQQNIKIQNNQEQNFQIQEDENKHTLEQEEQLNKKLTEQKIQQGYQEEDLQDEENIKINSQIGQIRQIAKNTQNTVDSFKSQEGKPQIRIQTKTQKQIIIKNNTLQNVNSLDTEQVKTKS